MTDQDIEEIVRRECQSPEAERFMRRGLSIGRSLGCSKTERELLDGCNAMRLALMVLLNHVEPGYDNCKTIARLWLESARAVSAERDSK